ncbi:uncharacterized protein LOC124150168 [Haliotis rufescens]|uniref:uncharacterized protein LOC124150168 n=1 Tax=Haliotis rufescens TaxID=6454 RepID=UPI00201F80F8|nr:uncharacterized protein LOC124150168 [Haliotis rufescens]
MYLPEAVTEPTNRNFTISINVTESHFGDVELIFLCNGQQLNVSHRSVTQLQQSTSTTVSGTNVPTTQSVGAPSTEIPPKDVSTLLIVAAGVTSAVIIILIITIACCCCSCRKKVTRSADKHAHDDVVVTLSQGKRNQAEDNVVIGPGGSASGGDNLHPETRGEYVALDRNAVQPSNIYEQLGTYEEIGNM